MDKQAISCFATLSFTEFEEIRSKAKSHIERGGLESALPSANKIWMLAGFELFKELKKEWECIEVFPHATMKRIGAASITKNARGGPLSQLLSVARFTQWPERVDSDAIKLLMRMVGSPSHDAVDAYASAWIAALDESQREPLGCPPEDAIWVPKLPQ